MIDPGILQAFDLVEDLLPTAIGAVKALIEAGHSPADAAAIVKRDIKSRSAEYTRMQAEDHAALRVKHGLPPLPAHTAPEFEEP